MRTFPFLFLLVLAGVVAAPLRAQLASDVPAGADATPAGATVINSDELRMDQVGRTAVFSGNVVVDGANFHMTCEEMTVFFTSDSKIDNIVAKGNVIILQPQRITHCGQAQYFREQDKFILTDQPDILDNKNEIKAPIIIIHRANQSLETQGRTTTKIIDAGANAPK
jgi:lipopolysaccharide transport protein LptA